ncbi:glycosyltransferase [Dongia soli]|uniref:Glycosyltransferase n=1 Tax=Dongia soli TaxID=600628 RepID=A0ABU5EFM0_9PROT|nr:glycosyltransferase [Dongia soli]MDY0885151.1 glycosyltransferase [Dongia soli]
MNESSAVPSYSPPALKSSIQAELICFSHLRWDFVWQRPQHLLSRAARLYRVLYIEEPVFVPHEVLGDDGFSGDKNLAGHFKISERPGGITIAVPVLAEGGSAEANNASLRSLLRQLVPEPRPCSRILWYYTPAAIEFTMDLTADVVVYDNMDELSAFLGASSRLVEQERALFERADVVFTGGMSLYASKSKRHPNVHAFPSSIDALHFLRARNPLALPGPQDQADIPAPRIGFFGVIDERLNQRLIADLADRCPDWQFIMIGPVVKIDPAGLPIRPNLHWLGSKPYAELPTYLAGWDAGFMPFALNDATRFISPTKTLEFLAGGIPVVSTPITDVVSPYKERGLVEIADTASAFADRLSDILKRRADKDAFNLWLAEVDHYLSTTSWDKSWDSMRTLLEGTIKSGEEERRQHPLEHFAEPSHV